MKIVLWQAMKRQASHLILPLFPEQNPPNRVTIETLLQQN
ncbi:hypothetical protein SETIT_5G045700v2 [Setaria italica]|uniref:Uncharacterized protein n=1 Tax=Setaria italica TaxID=4555 RepID=A0A368R169_SETIT|nr:hypothetical protein SETIT_5G045700v2 [Setaria italica]